MTDPQSPEAPRGAPALSVVMPAYNAERYIDLAIDSILTQTFADLELVVVDDASTDGTWEAICARASLDSRIRPSRNEGNLGVSRTIARGIDLARASLIGRMDADDISLPNRFEKQMALLQSNPHFAVVGCFASHTNEQGRVLSLSPTGPRSEAEFDDLRARGEATMVFGGTALFRKDLFDLVGGFDPAITIAEDLEIFDRMADHGPVVAVPEPLLLYRLHETSQVRRRFFEGRQIHRFVKARRMARVENRELDIQSYRKWEQGRPLPRRILTWLNDQGQFHYREAGMAFGNNHKRRFVAHLGIALLANPVFVGRRLWNQRLSPAARAQTDSS